MTKREKLFARAMSNPKGLSFDEFQTLLRQAGWIFDHQKKQPPDLVLADRVSAPCSGGPERKGQGLSGRAIPEAI